MLASEKSRLHELLTDAVIRLNVLVSDILALAGRAIVKALIEGQPILEILDLAVRLRASRDSEAKWRGVILDSPQTALENVRRTRIQTGLTVNAQIFDAVNKVGRKCSHSFRDIKDRAIRHDEILGKWNYIVDAKEFAELNA